MLKRPELILASSSPRRRELLDRVRITPVVQPADIDETPQAGETPKQLVERLSLQKAATVAAGDDAARNDVVIGADTTIDLDGVSLGKPEDDDEARAMLRSLSGRSHRVFTGVSVVAGSVSHTAASTSEITFRPLTDHEIDWYVATGEPQGKAGAYALQGASEMFITEIVGSYSGVIGLPLSLLDDLLGRLGRPLLSWARPREVADA